MASFNNVVLVGNVTRDPEIRYTPGGIAVGDLSLAVNDRRKGQNGEWVDEVSFVDVTLWGRTAEIAGENLKKGACILIQGRLKQETWEKDGQKRSKLKVVCEQMKFMDRKGAASGGDEQGPRDDQPHNSQPQQGGPPADDVPF